MPRLSLAVIPAAGEGRRWRPLSRHVPKELLPVGAHPLIAHVLRNLHQVGVPEVIAVVHEEKRVLAEFLATRTVKVPHIHVVYHDQRNGVLPAIARALQDEHPRAPVLVVYPDNFFPTGARGLERFVVAAQRCDRTLVAFVRLTEELLQASGAWAAWDLRPTPDSEGFLHISSVGEKGTWRPRSPWKSVGLWALHPQDLPVLHRLVAEAQNDTQELDDVHLFQELARQRRLRGFAFPDPVIDAGNPRGYILAWKKFLEATG